MSNYTQSLLKVDHHRKKKPEKQDQREGTSNSQRGG